MSQMPSANTIRHFREAVESLKARQPMSELRRLWLEAADASEALSAHYALPPPPANEDCAECDRLEDRRTDAERALRDHLLLEHGLTTADLNRCPL